MRVIYSHSGGLDVHKKTVVACRRRFGGQGQLEVEIRVFGTTLVELLALVDWLLEWELTHVAMESTGEYWKPVYNLLEGVIEVFVVNAKHVHQVPGRKTDQKDAEWLAELMQYGLLKASFIPPRPQRELRDLTRYRTRLVQDRAREVNRLQKGLEDANIKLSSVATDIMGQSGRAILSELAAGQTNASALAQLAKGRLRNKLPELEQALTGRVRAHHRFLLAQQLVYIDFLEEQIELISQRIGQQLEQLSPSPPPSSASPGPEPAEPAPTESTGPTPLSGAEAVALLDTIPGVDHRVAEIILAELGLDMRRFQSAKHAAAWAGLAPGNHQSGGKRYSGRTREGNQALQQALCEAAWAASRTKGTYLATLYHRLAARRGKKRAIVAVAHSILVSAYHMLLRQQTYHDLGGNYFDERKKESLLSRLLYRLQKLGYTVQLEPLMAPA
jgi:transposase